MNNYLGVIGVIAILWLLAGLKWWFFDKNPSEWRDMPGNIMMGIICLALVIGAFMYQADREYPPNNGEDYAYYAREAGIKKHIDNVLSRKDSGKKPARRLNEDLYEKDIPIEDMIKEFWKSGKFL